MNAFNSDIEINIHKHFRKLPLESPCFLVTSRATFCSNGFGGALLTSMVAFCKFNPSQ